MQLGINKPWQTQASLESKEQGFAFTEELRELRGVVLNDSPLEESESMDR